MQLLYTISEAQKQLRENMRRCRLVHGFTQAGLAQRSGVKLPTLRRFEQQGAISLESFLKLLMVLDGPGTVINAVKPLENEFSSIDDVLKDKRKKERKNGWRK